MALFFTINDDFTVEVEEEDIDIKPDISVIKIESSDDDSQEVKTASTSIDEIIKFLPPLLETSDNKEVLKSQGSSQQPVNSAVIINKTIEPIKIQPPRLETSGNKEVLKSQGSSQQPVNSVIINKTIKPIKILPPLLEASGNKQVLKSQGSSQQPVTSVIINKTIEPIKIQPPRLETGNKEVLESQGSSQQPVNSVIINKTIKPIKILSPLLETSGNKEVLKSQGSSKQPVNSVIKKTIEPKNNIGEIAPIAENSSSSKITKKPLIKAKPRLYECTICQFTLGFSTPYLERLDQHHKKHHVHDILSCEKCKLYTCSLPSLFIKHKCAGNNKKEEKSVKNSKFKCHKHKCSYKTNSYGEITNHWKYVHRLACFQCDKCDAVYFIRGALEKHQEVMHESVSCLSQFNCRHCEYKTKRNENFDLHMRVQHGPRAESDRKLATNLEVPKIVQAKTRSDKKLATNLQAPKIVQANTWRPTEELAPDITQRSEEKLILNTEPSKRLAVKDTANNKPLPVKVDSSLSKTKNQQPHSSKTIDKCSKVRKTSITCKRCEFKCKTKAEYRAHRVSKHCLAKTKNTSTISKDQKLAASEQSDYPVLSIPEVPLTGTDDQNQKSKSLCDSGKPHYPDLPTPDDEGKKSDGLTWVLIPISGSEIEPQKIKALDSNLSETLKNLDPRLKSYSKTDGNVKNKVQPSDSTIESQNVEEALKNLDPRLNFYVSNSITDGNVKNMVQPSDSGSKKTTVESQNVSEALKNLHPRLNFHSSTSKTDGNVKNILQPPSEETVQETWFSSVKVSEKSDLKLTKDQVQKNWATFKNSYANVKRSQAKEIRKEEDAIESETNIGPPLVLNGTYMNSLYIKRLSSALDHKKRKRRNVESQPITEVLSEPPPQPSSFTSPLCTSDSTTTFVSNSVSLHILNGDNNNAMKESCTTTLINDVNSDNAMKKSRTTRLIHDVNRVLPQPSPISTSVLNNDFPDVPNSCTTTLNNDVTNENQDEVILNSVEVIPPLECTTEASSSIGTVKEVTNTDEFLQSSTSVCTAAQREIISISSPKDISNENQDEVTLKSVEILAPLECTTEAYSSVGTSKEVTNTEEPLQSSTSVLRDSYTDAQPEIISLLSPKDISENEELTELTPCDTTGSFPEGNIAYIDLTDSSDKWNEQPVVEEEDNKKTLFEFLKSELNLEMGETFEPSPGVQITQSQENVRVDLSESNRCTTVNELVQSPNVNTDTVPKVYVDNSVHKSRQETNLNPINTSTHQLNKSGGGSVNIRVDLSESNRRTAVNELVQLPNVNTDAVPKVYVDNSVHKSRQETNLNPINTSTHQLNKSGEGSVNIRVDLSESNRRTAVNELVQLPNANTDAVPKVHKPRQETNLNPIKTTKHNTSTHKLNKSGGGSRKRSLESKVDSGNKRRSLDNAYSYIRSRTDCDNTNYSQAQNNGQTTIIDVRIEHKYPQQSIPNSLPYNFHSGLQQTAITNVEQHQNIPFFAPDNSYKWVNVDLKALKALKQPEMDPFRNIQRTVNPIPQNSTIVYEPKQTISSSTPPVVNTTFICQSIQNYYVAPMANDVSKEIFNRESETIRLEDLPKFTRIEWPPIAQRCFVQQSKEGVGAKTEGEIKKSRDHLKSEIGGLKTDVPIDLTSDED